MRVFHNAVSVAYIPPKGAYPSHLCSSGSPDPERQDQAILHYKGDERDGPSRNDARPGNRSAGACPPRSLHGEGNPLACACGHLRGPTPYGEREAFYYRRAGAPSPAIAPISVVRDRQWVGGKTGQDQAILPYREDKGSGSVAQGTGPRDVSPRGSDGEGQALALRGRGRLFLTVAQGTGPRDVRWEEGILGPLGP